MALELSAPMTVYAAKVFDLVGEAYTYWVPVESYARDICHVPPRYNLFCEICRRAVIDFLLEKFEGKVNGENCCWNSGNKGPCTRENHLARPETGITVPRFLMRVKGLECATHLIVV